MIGKIHMINPDKNIVEYGRIGNGITESTLATKLRSVKPNRETRAVGGSSINMAISPNAGT